jgi:hypothetical protein
MLTKTVSASCTANFPTGIIFQLLFQQRRVSFTAAGSTVQQPGWDFPVVGTIDQAGRLSDKPRHALS